MFHARIFALTLLCKGNLISHSGYELTKAVTYSAGSEYHLHDYDPSIISQGITAGALLTTPWAFFKRPMYAILCISDNLSKEMIPLRGMTIGSFDSQYDSFIWYGSVTDIDKKNLYLSIQPQNPENRSCETRFFDGVFFQGTRLSQLTFILSRTYFKEINTRYTSGAFFDTTSLFSWQNEYQNDAYQLTFSQEFFLTPYVSFTINVSANVNKKAKLVYEYYDYQSAYSVNRTASMDIKIVRPFYAGTELIVSCNSGEITSPLSKLASVSGPYPISYYRAYLMALNVSLRGF